MKAEEQRVAIGRFAGWICIGGCCASDYHGWIRKGVASSDGMLPLPDYLNSLDAMHEAEKVLLTGDGWQERLERYSSKLMAAMEDADPVIHVRFMNNRVALRYYTLHAPAAQRAEAFLKATGLWKEDK